MKEIVLTTNGVTVVTSKKEMKKIVKFLRGLLIVTTNDDERTAYEKTIAYITDIYS